MTHTHPAELIQIGKTLESHQDWDLAQNIYSHFILQANDPQGFMGMARVLDAQQKNDLALEALEDGWIKTKNPEIKRELERKFNSLLEKLQDQPDQAFEIAARTIECGIDLDLAINVLIKNSQNREIEAATLLERLLPLRPDEDLDILHACATLYHKAGDKQKARDIITYMLRR